MRVVASALADPSTGVGVLQRHLYKGLTEQGLSVACLPKREFGLNRVSRLRGVLAGALHKPVGDVFLSTTTPLPFRASIPTVAYVYDVRWLRTRSWAGRIYRRADLIRTLQTSRRVITISHSVAAELENLVPDLARKIRVVYPGPGQVDSVTVPSTAVAGRVLLIGSARHKRNEEAVRSIAAIEPAWIKEVVGIALSQEAQSAARAARGRIRYTLLPRVSAEELIRQLRAAEYFVHLGVEEGFGLPYIEALRSGCQLVVANHSLTKELLGSAAIFVPQGGLGLLSGLNRVEPVPLGVRVERSRIFSWEKCVSEVVEILEECVG